MLVRASSSQLAQREQELLVRLRHFLTGKVRQVLDALFDCSISFFQLDRAFPLIDPQKKLLVV